MNEVELEEMEKEELLGVIKAQRNEIGRLNTIIKNIGEYIDRMSYCEIVDNPKKELSRILTRKE